MKIDRPLACVACVAVLAATLVACTSSPATTSVATSTPAPTVSTTSPPTTEASKPSVVERAVPPVTTGVPDGWELTFSIGYGAAVELLGTAPGGENLQIGPEYGAPAPDGTWWFLDAAKSRFAHFDRAGTYLGEVVATPDVLVGGQYFPYQLPRVLADGTLIATRFDESTTVLLELADGATQRVTVPEIVVVIADDGGVLYGFAEDQSLRVVDPTTGTVEPTDWLRSASGMRYRLSFGGDGLVVEQPDQGRVTTIRLISGLDGAVFRGAMEAAVGADDTIHLYLIGVSETDEATQLGGYLTIDSTGAVSDVAAIQDPFSEADPGSPSRLHIAAGSSSPSLVIVGVDGVSVFGRS